MASNYTSLLSGGATTEQYNIPIEKLDYIYVGKCTDIKELEKILKVLRSGKEGYYPELEKLTEEKLTALCPQSKALRKDAPITDMGSLDKTEKTKLSNDLQDWLSDVKSMDSSLKNAREISSSLHEEFLPPPRSVGGGSIKVGDPKNLKPATNSKPKRVKPRDYREWDKINIDEELAKVDESKSTANHASVNDAKSRKSKVSGKVNLQPTTDLTEAELLVKSQREKNKGNEAYRSGDYEEAAAYYSRSISVHPLAASYNNRALVYVKMSKWEKAIEDCNKVIELEPANVKALIRRGMAYKGIGDLKKGLVDVKYVLEIDPNNKTGKELHSELNASLSKIEEHQAAGKGRRLVIQEVESDSSEESDAEEQKETSDTTPDPHTKENGTSDGHVDPVKGGEEQTLCSENVHGQAEQSTDNPLGIITNLNDETPSEVVERLDCKEENAENLTPEEANEQDGAPAHEPIIIEVPELPANVELLKTTGGHLFKKGQYGEAITEYEKAIQQLSKSKSLYRPNLATLYSNRAACRLKIGDCSGAVQDCTQALEIIPNTIKPLLRRAMAYETLEKYKESYVDFKHVLALDHSGETHRVAYQGTTRCTRMLQDLYNTKWRERLPALPKVSPCDVPILRTAGTATNSSNTATVVSADKRASHPVPQLADEERFQQLKTEGNGFVQKGHFSKAINSYCACLELFQDRVVCYTNRALCYLRTNEPKNAEMDCTSALNLEPENVKALFRRAQAKKMLEEYKESLADLTKLLKIDPKNVAAKKEIDVVKNYYREALKNIQQTRNQPRPNETAATQKPKQSKKNGEVKKNTKKHSPRSSKHSDINRNTKETSAATIPTQERRKMNIEEVEGSSESDLEKETGKDAVDSASKNVHVNNNPVKVAPVEPKPTPISDRTDPSPSSDGQIPSGGQATAGFKFKMTGSKPYEFMQAWMTLKGVTDTRTYAELVLQVPPEQLPKVISNKLDGYMLETILTVIDKHLADEGKVSEAYHYLEHLCKVPRFDIVKMFLSDREKKNMEELFNKLSRHTCHKASFKVEDVNRLKVKYSILK